MAVARDSASDTLKAVVKLLDDEMHASVAAASGSVIDALEVEEKLPDGVIDALEAAVSGCAADTYEAVAKDFVCVNALGAQENGNRRGLWLPDVEEAGEVEENPPALLPSVPETAHETRGGKVNSRCDAKTLKSAPAYVPERDLAMGHDIPNCCHGP